MDSIKTILADFGAFSFSIGSHNISLLGIIKGIVTLIAVFWVTEILVRNIERRIRASTGLSYNLRELLLKFLKISLYFIAIVIAMGAVGINITAFAVFGGALGVGLGLGLQKITANFVSGVTLLLEKSVKLGDFIQIGNDIQGFVRAMNIRYTLIETAKGTEILVPNETLTTTNVINWTLSDNKGRVEINLIVPYEEDTKKIKALLVKAAKENPKCLKDPEVNCFLKRFSDNGVEYMLAFWVQDVTDGLLSPQSDVMERIVELFAENNIHFAKPIASNLLDNSKI